LDPILQEADKLGRDSHLSEKEPKALDVDAIVSLPEIDVDSERLLVCPGSRSKHLEGSEDVHLSAVTGDKSHLLRANEIEAHAPVREAESQRQGDDFRLELAHGDVTVAVGWVGRVRLRLTSFRSLHDGCGTALGKVAARDLAIGEDAIEQQCEEPRDAHTVPEELVLVG
jgi:hypothetical protein